MFLKFHFIKFRLNSYYLIYFIACNLVACAHVDAWERGNLAKPQMAIETNPLLNSMRAHNYGSREAGASNSFAGGGGCGCY
jgi:hypothetical protein